MRRKRERAVSSPAVVAAAKKLAPLRLSSANPCRVLVVDDDPLVCTRLGMLLMAAQYEVEVAASGEEALRILETVHCHIVLTDWEMPDMDGLALCRHLRLQRRESYVYILMLTIRDSAPDLLAGLAAGADDYVVKGASVNEILARLETGRRISYGENQIHTRLRDESDVPAPIGLTVALHGASLEGKHPAYGRPKIDTLRRDAALGNRRKNLK